MKISMVHENKLKVILSPSDMEELELDYRKMDRDDENTRRALLYILEQAGKTERFSPKGARLYIETYPCEGGGCVLYFTCLYTGPGGKARLEPVLFEFDSAEEMIDGLCGAYRRYRQRIHRSDLHLLDGRYRLTVYPLDYSDRLSVYFLGEYGRRVEGGALLAAYTAEHGRALAEEDALGVIWRYFGEDGVEEEADYTPAADRSADTSAE